MGIGPTIPERRLARSGGSLGIPEPSPAACARRDTGGEVEYALSHRRRGTDPALALDHALCGALRRHRGADCCTPVAEPRPEGSATTMALLALPSGRSPVCYPS